MKHLILPALSLALLASVPAQAQAPVHSYLQLAQDNPDRRHQVGVQSSPAVVPAGAVDNSSERHDRKAGTGGTGGASHGGTGTGGAATTAGGHGAGSTGGHGGAAGSPATGTPAIIGGQAGGTGSSGGHGAGTGTATGSGQMGGTGTTGSHNRAGAGTGGAMTGSGRGTGTTGDHNRGTSGTIDRTGGGILLPGTPTGGHAPGGTVMGGSHTGGTVFGTRPPNWNRYPRTFDRGTYQRNYSAPRHYHWQSYNRPSGWYYRRWVFGQIFPRIFWGRDYWLTDYWMFDLPVPPYGYVWVRYGDDALLVNKRTGRVLQVVYDLFD